MSNLKPDKVPFDCESERIEKLNSMQNPELRFSQLDKEIRSLEFGDEERALIAKALRFISETDLIGREKNYPTHALRVAHYYARFGSPVTGAGVALGILHNALEVTAADFACLNNEFGRWLAESVRSLTLDRRRKEIDGGYLAGYYAALSAADETVPQIKILDKLDNLLVLFLNPSAEIRSSYCLEIEDYVIPLVNAYLPGLRETFLQLVQQARHLPHRTASEYLRLKI